MLALEVVAAAAPNAVAEAKPVRQDLLAIQVGQATLARQAAQETQEDHPNKFANRPHHHRVTHVQLAHLDLQELLDQLVMPVQTDNLDKEAVTQLQDLLDLQDHQDNQAPQVTLELQVNQAPLPNPKKAAQEPQDQRETPDHQDHQDLLVNQDNQEAQANPVAKDQTETQEPQETTDSPVNQDRQEAQAAAARRVFARNTAPWTVVSSSRTELVAVKRPLISSSGDLHPPKTCPMICPFLLVDQKTAIYYVFLLWMSSAFRTSKA